MSGPTHICKLVLGENLALQLAILVQDDMLIV
jgi:hypothetical protein